MTDRTACFTGHRFLPKERIPKIQQDLINTIDDLIASGVVFFGSGGAIGFDMLAGFTVLEMKRKYPQIKLIMVLPCHNQDTKWKQPDKDKYRELLERADKIIYLQEDYDDGCMLRHILTIKTDRNHSNKRM